MQDLLRRLAAFSPGDEWVLSVYLDMRPQATGENPGVRSGEIVLRTRLRTIEKTLLPRGPTLDGFRDDSQQVEHWLSEHASSAAQGVALFSCKRRGLFETVEAGVAFTNQVMLEPLPDLFQLARMADNQETAAVVLVDTRAARIFLSRQGFLDEVAGQSNASIPQEKRKVKGIDQPRYQRRIQNQRLDFAQEIAQELDRLVEQEDVAQVILAGDAVTIPVLRKALSARVLPLVHEQPLQLDIRTPRDQVLKQVAPILDRVEDEEDHAIVDRLVDAVKSQGLGVDGVIATRAALERGQADTLVVAEEETALPTEQREELLRLAAAQGVPVEVVRASEALRQLGGTGAFLRYRLIANDKP